MEHVSNLLVAPLFISSKGEVDYAFILNTAYRFTYLGYELYVHYNYMSENLPNEGRKIHLYHNSWHWGLISTGKGIGWIGDNFYGTNLDTKDEVIRLARSAVDDLVQDKSLLSGILCAAAAFHQYPIFPTVINLDPHNAWVTTYTMPQGGVQENVGEYKRRMKYEV